MAQYALVTGASSGIGAATAKSLASQGFDLLLVGRNEERLQEVRSFCGEGSIPVRCDFADMRSLATAIVSIRALLQTNGLSAIVHCAGAFAMTPYESTSASAVEDIFRVNVLAPFVLTRELLPELQKARGHVVFVNSSVATNPQASMTAYSMSKAALKAEADTLRQAVNRYGIKVTSVYPGRTATPMQALMCSVESRDYRPEAMIQPEDVASTISFAIALGERAELTDIPIRSLRPY